MHGCSVFSPDHHLRPTCMLRQNVQSQDSRHRALSIISAFIIFSTVSFSVVSTKKFPIFEKGSTLPSNNSVSTAACKNGALFSMLPKKWSYNKSHAHVPTIFLHSQPSIIMQWMTLFFLCFTSLASSQPIDSSIYGCTITAPPGQCSLTRKVLCTGYIDDIGNLAAAMSENLHALRDVSHRYLRNDHEHNNNNTTPIDGPCHIGNQNMNNNPPPTLIQRLRHGSVQLVHQQRVQPELQHRGRRPQSCLRLYPECSASPDGKSPREIVLLRLVMIEPPVYRASKYRHHC